MKLLFDAACCSNIGKIRKNNEDNLFFFGTILNSNNNGTESILHKTDVLRNHLCFAVFDGMGGEQYGEIASYHAAIQMADYLKSYTPFLPPDKRINRIMNSLNNAVVFAQKKLGTDHMGTTAVMLYYLSRNMYVCNVGDSRAYLFRDGNCQQISTDHVLKCPNSQSRKAPLTQYLGIDPLELALDPCIEKLTPIRGDTYLICSDGLTDMLSDYEIHHIIQKYEDVQICTQELMSSALERGGRDNITVIICRIK